MWCCRSRCLPPTMTGPRPPTAQWPPPCRSIPAPASECKRMPLSDLEPLSGDIVEETVVLSMADLSRMMSVDERHIVEWVEEGVISVLQIDVSEWRFSGAALRRARIALRLQRDLGVNLPGVALALDLLEELEQLRRQRRSER